MNEDGRGSGTLDAARKPAGLRDIAHDRHRHGGHHPDARPHRGDGGRHTYAAIDLGTNNCRLLVARPTQEGFRVVDAFSRIIRLGEGLAATGRISDAAFVRAVEALSVCRDKMRSRNVSRARLIATEACRTAENGQAFLDHISREVGLDLEIIDRETEAVLAATGCTPLIDPDARGVLVFDIGGGSSELIRLGPALGQQTEPGDGGPPRPQMRGWVSLPFGVVTIAERHGGVDVSPELFEVMIQEVSAQLAPFAAEHGGDLDRMHLLGTSGTVTTIAGVFLDLPRYERRKVDGIWLSDVEVSDVTAQLLAMSYDERVLSPCIGAERADLVLAGCAILAAIRRAFPCPKLRVADRGLREGILVQLMREDQVWRGPRAP